MLKKRVGSVFVVIGAVLLAAALLLFLYNQYEDKQAGEAAGAALSEMQAQINEYYPGRLDLEGDTSSTEATAETIPEPTELEVVNIGGNDYIGYLSIPYFELELPIMDDWSEEKLQVAPCLQFGSPLTNDAVIAGHNFKQHFRMLHDIEVGEYLTFTTMSGYVIEYGVVNVQIIDPTNVDFVKDSEYDMILYTCTSGGQARVVVCCDRLENIEENEE